MRAMWTGAVSFGLVNVPVRLYTATTNHDIAFHQVHEADRGRIRQKRTCEVCGEVIDYADIVKGYETDDGQLVIIDSDDLATLPVAAGHEISVVQFVPAHQVDPLLLDRSYYLEPETKAVTAYALLREALRSSDRMAVVTVALRQRETLALLRVRQQVIVLQTTLWPDEVREPDFEVLASPVALRDQELTMASTLVESLVADFDPSGFSDDYQAAVLGLIEYKRTHDGARPAPPEGTWATSDDMPDLLTALRRSVEAAGGAAPDEPDHTTTTKKTPPKKSPGKEGPKKTAATTKKATAKNGAAAAKKPADASPTAATGTEDAPPTQRTRRA